MAGMSPTSDRFTPVRPLGPYLLLVQDQEVTSGGDRQGNRCVEPRVYRQKTVVVVEAAPVAVSRRHAAVARPVRDGTRRVVGIPLVESGPVVDRRNLRP